MFSMASDPHRETSEASLSVCWCVFCFTFFTFGLSRRYFCVCPLICAWGKMMQISEVASVNPRGWLQRTRFSLPFATCPNLYSPACCRHCIVYLLLLCNCLFWSFCFAELHKRRLTRCRDRTGMPGLRSWQTLPGVSRTNRPKFMGGWV